MSAEYRLAAEAALGAKSKEQHVEEMLKIYNPQFRLFVLETMMAATYLWGVAACRAILFLLKEEENDKRSRLGRS